MVVPLVIGAELRRAAHVYAPRQRLQVVEEGVLTRRWREVDEADVGAKILVGVCRSKERLREESQRAGDPVGLAAS